MNKLLAKELGFLGINVDSNFDIAWLKTEVADKIREGDQTAIYRLINFARHSDDPEIRNYANIIANIYQDKVDNYCDTGEVKKEEKEYKKAESAEDIVNGISEAIEDGGEANIEVTTSIDLTTGDTTSIVVPEGSTVDLKVADGVEVKGVAGVLDVKSGANLTLSGGGTIKTTTKKTNSAVYVSGEGSVVNIDGVTIDTVSESGVEGNYAYGVYAKDGATVNFTSGTIHVAGGSCISTNNTTGGGTINISGGELLCEGSYAVYVPAQGEVNITGGKVQGINARMGTINISGNAEIIPTTITDAGRDDIGDNISTSGCIWLGDTIAIVAGTYKDTKGVDTVLNIEGNVTVKSNFRSAIGIYAVDTLEQSNVQVNIADGNKVSTTDTEYSSIKVYDHDYISAAATAKGKSYTPKVDSVITVNVGGSQVYPEI